MIKRNPEIKKRLDNVRNTKPIVKAPDESSFVIILTQGNSISGVVEGKQRQRVHIEELNVDQELLNHGIGSRLIRTFFRYCTEIGAEYVDSHIIT